MKTLTSFAFSLIFIFSLQAQSAVEGLKLGLQISPTVSWISSNDNRIESTGDNGGLKIGIMAEKYFGENYAFVGAFSFALDQGGTLRYEYGGNFLPKSELSNPNYNKGQKPLPEDVEITYHMDYLEVMGGLRLQTNPIGRFQIYTELPLLGVGLVTKSRGDISSSGVNTEDERIGDDMKNLILSWGAGAGADISLGDNLVLTGGIFFQQSLTDVTRDKGNFAFDLLDDQGTSDPFDDTYETQEENSRGKLGNLTFRIGIKF